MPEVDTKPVDKLEAKESASKPTDAGVSVVDLYKSAPTDLFKSDSSGNNAADKQFGNLQIVDSQTSSEATVRLANGGSDKQIGMPILEAAAPATELQKQSSRLLEAAEDSKLGTAMDLTDRMSKFERVAREKGLSESEVAKTYGEVARLYEAKDKPDFPIDKRQRHALAVQVLDNAADPTSIDQGGHSTCNVTTIESRVYSRTPSEAARIVADVATTGQHTSRSGLTVKLDKDSLIPQNGAEQLVKGDGVRDYAGQLFQVTAVNLAYQKDNPNIRYEQKPPKPGQTPPDSGERLMDYSTNPPTEAGRPNLLFRTLGSEDKGIRQPNLINENLRDVGNEITGEKDRNWILDTGNVKSRQDFENQLAQAKRDGRMPIVVVVHTGSEPFRTDSGNGTAGGSGGWHVVNVTDYQSGSPPRIAVDNQWGKKADHISPNSQLSPDLLYYSMRDPKDNSQALEMAQRAKEQKREGSFDERFQLESLRKLSLTRNISEERFTNEFQSTVKEFDARYKSGQLVAPDGAWESRLNQMNSMPISSQLQTLIQMKDSGKITTDSFYKVAADRYARSEAKGASDGNNPFIVSAQIRSILDSLPQEQKSVFRTEMLAAAERHKRK